MPYCSVPCSKAHKENHPPDTLPSTAPSQVTSNLPTRSSPPDPFSILLDHEADFRKLFERYPSLPSTLARIQRTTLPPADQPSTTTPGGLPWKLGPEHLPGGQKKQAEPWTRQVGLRNGAKALRQARMDPGEEGDGVREYCVLVTYLLDKAKEQRAGKQARDVTATVRAEVVAEEAEVIRGLLQQERD
ncbi:hypothetical protein DL546_001281 [Coniochaeta pulveracea]|uniref:HIT-type domain-containing protein n=1 Tax=Coniochaeta pulveracea TaxID=177199 RepID=A0A420XWW0_9PEZI|nr:hypothetical protein DL546_001281 [Coniochaeta pulveracea]